MMSLFEHDDNAIGQTEAISNIYVIIIPSNPKFASRSLVEADSKRPGTT